MLILSGPSGAGKTVLSRKLLSEYADMELSVSATTRKPRPGEVDGEHYHFIDEDTFREMAKNNAFLEWAEVFGAYYGTPRAAVEEALSEGRDVLFDIDWQGAQQLKQSAASDLVKVFVLPPSLKELEARLRKRDQDSNGVIEDRMSRARDEISHWGEYHYVIVNEDVEHSMNDLRAILAAERRLRKRQPWLNDFVRNLIRPF
ncbi:MAG: guanylate kinase [Robiginitomaculum sp.]|nr:MAG: guanylate kinase [Robiginitomaculum sp.]